MEIIRKCEYCGKDFTAHSGRAKYCPDCRVLAGRAKALEHYYDHIEERRQYVAKYNKEYHAGLRRGYSQVGADNNHWRGVQIVAGMINT